MLETVFLQVLNMSVTGGMVILFVLIARLLLKKAPKIFSYALWSVVLFRLCCPFSFESAMSLLPYKTGITPAGILYTQTPGVDVGIPAVSAAINAALPVPNLGDSVNPMQIVVAVAAVIWLVGIVALLIYSVVSLLKLRRRLKDAVHESGNIYTSPSLTSPFVMGLFSPKIYLPASLTAREKDYILLHEQTHIKRLDHAVKLFCFFVLCVHWFNPLVWVAFFLCGRDMELSCDEAVIKKLGSDVKKDYSTSLLTLATGRRIVGGTPLAFGEGDTKSRIKNVLNYKKPAFWVIVVSVIAVVAIGVGLMANPKEKSAELDAAQTLWDARTEYVGDNAAVGQLLGLLEFPDSLTYQFFALQTDGDERGVELSLIQDTIRPLTDLET
ncbi:MAG: M56 family metallopeptidase, partial [Oscillospiraceae bacterium]